MEAKKKKSLKASRSPILKHIEVDAILPFPEGQLIVWITCQAVGRVTQKSDRGLVIMATVPTRRAVIQKQGPSVLRQTESL